MSRHGVWTLRFSTAFANETLITNGLDVHLLASLSSRTSTAGCRLCRLTSKYANLTLGARSDDVAHAVVADGAVVRLEVLACFAGCADFADGLPGVICVLARCAASLVERSCWAVVVYRALVLLRSWGSSCAVVTCVTLSGGCGVDRGVVNTTCAAVKTGGARQTV